MKVPFLDLEPAHNTIRKELVASFMEVYESNNFILGKRVKKFETQYATFSNTNHAIGVSSGLDALTLCLHALKIGRDDEVIIPSNTYIATALAVSNVGATPVFVEPNLETANIDPSLIAAAITPRTKAIIPVHLYGQCCEMDQVMEIAQNHDLAVVEDNAQSHGASYLGKPSGSWGQLNATSFYPSKNLGALGDGGAITTNDSSLADKVKLLRNYGSSRKNDHEVIGYNHRLDELQAALLSTKLKHLIKWTEERQQIAKYYLNELEGMDELHLPTTSENGKHTYHLFVLRTQDRNGLKEALASRGVQTMIHYPVPPYKQKAYAQLNLADGAFPIADQLAETSLSLPLYPGMPKTQQEFVVGCIKEHFHA